MIRLKWSWLVSLLLVLTLAGCGGGEAPSVQEEAAMDEAPAGPPAVPIDPETVGAITGSVAFEGEAPRRARIRMDAVSRRHRMDVMVGGIAIHDVQRLSCHDPQDVGMIDATTLVQMDQLLGNVESPVLQPFFDVNEYILQCPVVIDAHLFAVDGV